MKTFSLITLFLFSVVVGYTQDDKKVAEKKMAGTNTNTPAVTGKPERKLVVKPTVKSDKPENTGKPERKLVAPSK